MGAAVTSFGVMAEALLDTLSRRIPETSRRPTYAPLQCWDPILLPHSIPFARTLALDKHKIRGNLEEVQMILFTLDAFPNRTLS